MITPWGSRGLLSFLLEHCVTVQVVLIGAIVCARDNNTCQSPEFQGPMLGHSSTSPVISITTFFWIKVSSKVRSVQKLFKKQIKHLLDTINHEAFVIDKRIGWLKQYIGSVVMTEPRV